MRRSSFLLVLVGLSSFVTGCAGMLNGAVTGATGSLVASAAGLDPEKVHLPRTPGANPLVTGKSLSTSSPAKLPAECGMDDAQETLDVSVDAQQICVEERLYTTIDVPGPHTAPGDKREGTGRRVLTAEGKTELMQTQFVTPPERIKDCRVLHRGHKRPFDHVSDPELHPEWGDQMKTKRVFMESRRACAPNTQIVTAKTSEIVVKRTLDRPGEIYLRDKPEGELVAWAVTAPASSAPEATSATSAAPPPSDPPPTPSVPVASQPAEPPPAAFESPDAELIARCEAARDKALAKAKKKSKAKQAAFAARAMNKVDKRCVTVVSSVTSKAPPG